MRTGSRWTIFTKLPVAFCGGSRSQGLTGAHGEAGDAALELTPAAVHVDLAAHPLADAQVGELGFLEVGVDPDLGERADGHQALAGLDVVAGVDVAAGDHAVDLGDDVAVAEVQLGLGEVAVGLSELGFGLLDCRRVGNQPGVDPVEVALGVLLEKLRHGLLGRRVNGSSGRSRAGPRSGATCRAPGGRRRSSRSRSAGNIAQVLALPRLDRKPEADASGVDGLEGLVDGRLVDLDRLARWSRSSLLMPPLGSSSSPRFRLACASSRLAFRLLSVATLARRLAIWVLTSSMACSSAKRSAADQADNAATPGPAAAVRSASAAVTAACLIATLNLVRLLVELDQQAALLHPIVVVDQDRGSPGRQPAVPRTSRGR